MKKDELGYFTDKGRDERGRFLPGVKQVKDYVKGGKALKKEELKSYLSKLYDLEKNNPLLDIMLEMAGDKDKKMRAKVIDLVTKRLPKKEVRRGPIISPLINEFLEWKVLRDTGKGPLIEDKNQNVGKG